MNGGFLMTRPLTCLATLVSIAGQTFAQIPMPSPPPWNIAAGIDSPIVSAPSENQTIYGALHCRLGVDDVLDRPLLLIEGLDLAQGWDPVNQGFGSITWGHIHGSDVASFPQGADFRPVLDSLFTLGIDVFFLDFFDGSDAVEDKAALTKSVLRSIRDFNQSDQAMALVGVSMGGLVGRLALAEMEADDELHCTGMFVAIDAPFQGATLPTGLQALLLGLASSSQEAMQQWHSLHSPAALQLLSNHSTSTAIHELLLQRMEEAGWPRWSRNINVINSHVTANPALTSSPLLQMEWELTEGIGSPFFLVAERWRPEWAGEVHEMASFCLPGELNPFSSVGWMNTQCIDTTVPETDVCNVPGSTAPHVSLFAQSIAASMPLNLETMEGQWDFSFVSHESALGTWEDANPWEMVSTALPTAPRESHASMATHHQTEFSQKLQSLWGTIPTTLPNQGVTDYTLGWHQPNLNQLGSLTLQTQGKLHVGNGVTPFHVTTQPCATTIRLTDGSELRVGNSETGVTGVLDMMPGSQLVLEEGSTVVVAAGSTLCVREFASLTLNGGCIVVKSGGTFRVNEDAMVAMMAEGLSCCFEPGSDVQLSGMLTAEGDGYLVWTNEGSIRWSESATFHVAENAAWQLDQEGQGSTLLEGSATLGGSGCFSLEGGVLSFPEPSSSLEVACNFNVSNCALISEGWHEGQDVTTHAKVRVDQSNLGDIRWNHAPLFEDPQSFRGWSNLWTDCVLQFDSSSANIWDNEFIHCHVHCQGNMHPFHIHGNHWTQAWHDDIPALTIASSPAPTRCEGNTWEGGVGLELNQASAVLTCNTWQNCTEACILQGQGPHCFAPACGGGFNRWSSNDIHFVMGCCEAPVLNDGRNLMGLCHEAFANGTLDHNASTWSLSGNAFVGSLIDNPWQSPLDGMLLSCDDTGQSIQPWMNSLMPYEGCPNEVKPVKTKHLVDGSWGILGQRINAGVSQDNPFTIPSSAERYP